MKKCIVPDCINEQRNKKCDVCKKHYYERYYKRGFFRDFSNGKKNPRDPNEFIVEGDICKIILYDKFSNPIGEAIIDTEDMERCKKYKWCAEGRHSENTYVMNAEVGKLHHFILQIEPSKKIQIDHKNRNKRDCRKDNLRPATNQQNQRNKGLQSNNTSGFIGVVWYVNPGKTSRWMAQIYIYQQRKHLGYFDTKDAAALAYTDAARELFGEFAVLNKVLRKVK